MTVDLDAPETAEESAPTPPEQGVSFATIAHLGAAYAVVAGVLWYIQSGTTAIIDPDGYYHIRWSRLLWEGLTHGHLPRFVWLPLTILNEKGYVDHHFLFHLLQIPFTFGPDLIAGAKAEAVLFGALAILSCYALILWARVRFPVAWLIMLVACSGPFLFRMSLPRAPAVTIVTLALALWLLFTRKYMALGVLSFFLVWMYSLFPLVGVLAGAWAVGVYFEEERIEWKPVAIVSVGMIGGLLVNPYFPQNLFLFIDHVKMKVSEEYEVNVGQEWYPYESWYLLQSSVVAWCAQVAGWVVMRTGRREGMARTICLFLFSTFLLVLTMKSRRFIEYWPPFAVVFLAFAAQPHLDAFRWSEMKPTWKRVVTAISAAAVVGGLVAAAALNAYQTRDTVDGETDPYAYAGGAAWLAEHTDEGALVFNTDWDDFPMLFFHNTHNVYTSGLDPTYLLHANPELSKLYEDITLGKKDDPGPLIRDRFGARYAFTDSGHKDFIRKATANGGMKIVYEDKDALVLEVVDNPPPADADSADK
ncbi:MAG TPA: hypothetical protein PLF26_06680 [Blastocatellia bacterium]|nr:hypothetical protein [Blastocatellia bacterium]